MSTAAEVIVVMCLTSMTISLVWIAYFLEKVLS